MSVLLFYILHDEVVTIHKELSWILWMYLWLPPGEANFVIVLVVPSGINHFLHITPIFTGQLTHELVFQIWVFSRYFPGNNQCGHKVPMHVN
jgi:hypothetical protein